MTNDVCDAFCREFDATLGRLAEMVRAIRKEDWSSGQETRVTPVHQVCHTVSVVLQYIRADADRRGIAICWKPQKDYPSQERLLDLIDVARRSIPAHVNEAVDRSSADRKWRTPPLHKLIYLLRHTIWHLCCLVEELKRRGYRISGHYTKTWKWVPPSGSSESG